MKISTLFTLWISLLLFFSCKQEEKEPMTDYLVLSGKIKNSAYDSLKIFDRFQQQLASIPLSKNKTFSHTFEIPEGYYYLDAGDEYTYIYLKPGFDLEVELDTKQFDQSITYSGTGARINNYLAKKILLQNSFIALDYPSHYLKLKENEFLKLTDSLHTLKQNLLQKQEKIDSGFAFIEAKSLDFHKLNKYAQFLKNAKEQKSEVSDTFPDPFKNIELNNEKLLISMDYLDYVCNYLMQKSEEHFTVKNPEADQSLKFVKLVQKEIQVPQIKEQIFYETHRWSFANSQKIDSVYQIILPALATKNYKAQVTRLYDSYKRMEKGNASPVFNLTDINGASVSLKELEGKLVYIDIWATWCVPCIREIPSLKKLGEHFKEKEITFVSICTYDTEERWKKMVAEKNLNGIQLFASEENRSFLNFYLVEYIPRFILIDREGKIIDGNAKNPSNPDLVKELEQYL